MNRVARALELPVGEPVVAAVIGVKRLTYFRLPKFAPILPALTGGISVGLSLPLSALLPLVGAAAAAGVFIDQRIGSSKRQERAKEEEQSKTQPTFVAATPSRVRLGPWVEGQDLTGQVDFPLGCAKADRKDKTILGLPIHHFLHLGFCDGRPDVSLVVSGFGGPIDELVSALSIGVG